MKKSLILMSTLCLLFSNTVLSQAKVQPLSNTTVLGGTNNIYFTSSNSTQNLDEALWPENQPTINSASAIVMEASTGAILYSKNINDVYYPASITKILTALLAIENSTYGETVTFSRESVFDVDLDSSRIGIDVGEELTMEQCLYGIMLESANEVSYAVAEHISGDVASFAELMNKKAAELGCLNTNFVNPNGLPNEEHYTTAYDMALISSAAINNDTFRKITSTRTYTIPPTNIQDETRYLANHHKFIRGTISYEGAIGGKTGYTSKAKYTLVTFAERNGLTLVSVIMYCDSIANEYSDTAAILDYGFDNFSIYNIAELENTDTVDTSTLFTKYSPLFNRNTSQLQISSKGNIVLPNTANYKDAKKEVIFSPITQVKPGENIIGSINYTYDDIIIGTADIIYNNNTTSSVLENSFIPTPAKNQEPNGSGATDSTMENTNLKKVIIGIILGVVAIASSLYLIFVEIPYRKRKNAYWNKRRKHKKNHSTKSDYVDY